jgi:hypothetical protein
LRLSAKLLGQNSESEEKVYETKVVGNSILMGVFEVTFCDKTERKAHRVICA